jgi:hypothetical protein
MVPTKGAASPKAKQYARGKMDRQISKFLSVFGGQLTCVNNVIHIRPKNSSYIGFRGNMKLHYFLGMVFCSIW